MPTRRRGWAYYRKKGDLADPNSGAARAWYEKSLAVLLRAREISQAGEKAFDEAQIAHTLPLTFRLADDVLYFNLAATYTELGRFPEALDALRYERMLTPSAPDPYDAMARVYAKQGDLAAAAVALDQKALVVGPAPETIATLQEIYARMPEGACAFLGDGRLNPECPLVLQLRCKAWLS
jgi:tetratricopeptide (TPR) repeat protein